MRPVMLALSMVLAVLTACAQQQQTEQSLRGLLSDHGAVTLAECGTGKVYWVRGADTLLSSIKSRLRDLTGQTSAGVVGTLRGEAVEVATAVGTAYPVHGTLWARDVVSVEPGRC